ncbi:MAG: glycosyl transferase family 1 [Bacteroidota bacterium]
MKRVLIISYYWPPAGGVSVLRSLKIAKYLRNYGWEPVVYTARNAQYPYFDDSNSKHVPSDIEIIRKPIIEPFNFFKKFTGRNKNDIVDNVLSIESKQKGLKDKLAIWVRANFFIPDARALWIKPSVQFLSSYLKKNPVDALFTDGPPHTNTVIGCELKKKMAIPWLADFQDPWSQVDYYDRFPMTKMADKKHKKMEQDVFKHADKITIVSPSWKEDIEKIGAKNVSVIYWGYDEDEYSEVAAELDTKSFTVSHSGSLGKDRFPKVLLDVLKEVTKEISELKEKMKFEVFGMVDHSISEYISSIDFIGNYVNHGVISRNEALQKTFASDLLLLLLNKADNSKGRLPAKLYEYLRAGKTILCLGDPESDAARIISKTQSGQTFHYDDYSRIKGFIKKLVIKENIKAQKVDPSIEAFEIRAQVSKIADFLDEIAA